LEVAVFSSGNGGNFEHLVQNQVAANFNIVGLFTDRECGAENVATKYGIEINRIPKVDNQLDFSNVLERLTPERADLLVLAGFMPIIPQDFISSWRGPIINTHPSLLPKHGGLGMYGVRVQESVIKSGDEFAGCTVHHVSSEVDMGEIIFQQKFKIPEGISAWDLGGIIFALEGPQLVNAIKFLGGMN
jgi:phosphoribosylglycinamide formyltransferase-1